MLTLFWAAGLRVKPTFIKFLKLYLLFFFVICHFDPDHKSGEKSFYIITIFIEFH